MAYKNILVAVDGSNEAELALKKAIEIAKRDEATLHLTYVIEHYHYPGDLGSFKNAQEKFGKELLEKYKRFSEDQGLNDVNTVIKFGSPKSMIPKSVASEVEADLIVCGATGVNAVERLFIGSVSENIARQATCDVLIIRNNE